MSASVSRAAFLRHWQALPDMAAKGRCDPFVVDQRLALYKSLMAQTGRAAITGNDDERHIFWGHGFQLYWQSQSGRLGAEAGIIDPSAWWGMMNFSLSVIPYLGAVEAGTAKALSFVPPAAGAGGVFDLSEDIPAVWQPMIEAWAAWFSFLAREAQADDLDALCHRAWHAHLVCIEEAGRLFTPAFADLPACERDFALGWTRMVDFFGAAARPTDLAALEGIDARPLPPFILDDEAAVCRLPAASATPTGAIMALGTMPQKAFDKQNRFWRRAMRRRAMRDQSADILAALFTPPLPLSMRLKLLFAAWRP